MNPFEMGRRKVGRGLEFAMEDYHEKGIKASTTQSGFIHISHAKLEEIFKNQDVMTSDIFLNI